MDGVVVADHDDMGLLLSVSVGVYTISAALLLEFVRSIVLISGADYGGSVDSGSRNHYHYTAACRRVPLTLPLPLRVGDDSENQPEAK